MEDVVEKKQSFKKFYILVIIVVFFWAGSFYGIYYSLDNWADIGTYGNLLGAINSLFSALAFVGIVFIILLQRKELRLRRLEITRARKELSRYAEAQENSERALKEQCESLKLTSQLSALNALVSTYSEQEIYWTGKHPFKENGARCKKEKYMDEVERILNGLNGDLDHDEFSDGPMAV